MNRKLNNLWSAILFWRRLAPRFSVLSILVVLLHGFSFGNAAGQTREIAKPGTISLGLVSRINRSTTTAHFDDFVRYVAAKLGSGSEIQGKVIVAPTTFELAKLIQDKQVDFYMDSPYPTYLLNQVYGFSKLLLRRWKGGIAEYRSLIFTKRAGEITRLEDLKGRILAFEDPESTSGYFLPRSFLTQKGFSFTDKNRYDPEASPTNIGYLFAYSQQKLLDWVLAKKVAAGAFSDADYASLDPKKKSELTILGETEPLPRQFVSVRKDLTPNLVNPLKNILLAMHENSEGRKILKNTDDTTKFDLFPEGDAGLRRRMAAIFRSAEKK